MKNWTCFCIFLIAGFFLYAQKDLQGVWKGQLVAKGLNSVSTTPFELYIQVKGKKISGSAYLHQENGEILQTRLEGVIYEDHSIYLIDTQHGETQVDSSSAIFFLKKYQLLYDRSIWESKLEGYWQEVMEQPREEEKRKMGRISLKKVKEIKKA